MYRNHTIGVVVTAYNEEGLVGTVLDRMPAFVDRVYAVDDCSTDGTWNEITQYASTPEADAVSFPLPDGGQSANAVVPLRHERNQGVGGAIKTGFRRALDDDVDIVAVIDGDGQMDPEQLPRLLDPIIDGKAVYAKGNRLAKPSHFNGMSPLRILGNIILTVLTRIASGYWHMSDPQNGYNAIDVETLEQLSLSKLYSGYGFRNDMLVRLNVHGATIADVSMPARYGDEESGIQYTAFIPRMSMLLLRRFCWRLWKRYGSHRTAPKPVSARSVCVLVGLAILARMRSRTRSPYSWLGTIGIWFGSLVMMLAMVESRYATDTTITVENDE